MKGLTFTLQQPPAWLIVLAGVLWIIYKAVYKDLNPGSLQIQDAIIQVVLILLSLIGVTGVAIAHAQRLINNGPPTMRMPTTRPPYDG